MSGSATAVAPRCHSCGDPAPAWSEGYRRLGIERCASCGSLAFHATQEIDFASLYGRDYFHGGEYSDYTGHHRVHARNFDRKLRVLRRHAPAPLRVLEIGCAYGYFVDHALRRGAAEAHGVDVSAAAIAFARERFGARFSLAGEPLPPGLAPNCVAAWDVWEHLAEPLDVFAPLVESLPRGGVLAVTTVDASALLARLRGPRWRQIHPPTHVHYPTYDGLARGFRSLGLEVVHHGHFAYHRALETYLDALRLGALVRSFPRLRTLPVLVGLRDIQFAIGRKP